VLERLDELKTNYKLFNSRMTGKGLFQSLAGASDAIHILEDMEPMTTDRNAQGVLRSALWAPHGRDRVVTWTTGTKGEESFTFRGGIIMLANRPLATLPELRALATRIAVLRLDVTDSEIEAVMFEMAAGGYREQGKLVLAPEQCEEVARFLLTECRTASCSLDLRLLINSYQDYLLWDGDHSGCHWQDLVATRTREAATHFRCEVETLSQEERRTLRRKVIREIESETNDPNERLRLYIERTGKSRSDYFKRKREVDSGEFDPEEKS
jgi:hypothetical protein